MFEIRRLGPEHISDLIGAIHGVAEFRVAHAEDYWSEQEIARWLSNPNDFCTGAFADEKLIGYCLSHWYRETGKLYLENIYVEPEHRRCGVGTALGQSIAEMVRIEACGRVRMILLVRINNNTAQRFFESIGFDRGDEMVWYQRDIAQTEL